MAITQSGQGNFNGVTEVTLIAGSATPRAARGLRIHNKDTDPVTITISKKVAGVLYELDLVTIQPGFTHRPLDRDDVVFLTAADQSIVGVMSGAPVTTQPSFVSSWVEPPSSPTAEETALLAWLL